MTTTTSHSPSRWIAAFRSLSWIALIALALTPLVMDFGARDDAYFTPKWCWMSLWTGLGLIGVFVPALGGRTIRLPLEPIWTALAVWAIWQWIAVIGAESPSLGFERARHVLTPFLAAVVAFQMFQRRHLRTMSWCFIAMAAITAVWVLIEDYVRAFWPEHVWLKANLADWRGYLSGGLGNTNHLGDFFALALIPALVMFGEARRPAIRVALCIVIVLISAALTICFSVGSMSGLILAAIVMLAMTLKRTRGRWFVRRAGRWGVLIALWAAMVAFFVIDQPLNPNQPGLFRMAFGSQRLEAGGPTRLAIWAQGLEMIRLKPAWGHGTGNFTYVFPRMDSPLLWDHPTLAAYQGQWTNAAHNAVMQAWIETGLVGMFLLILAVALAFHSLFHRLDEAGHLEWIHRLMLAGMLTALCGHAQMNFVLQHPFGLLCFVGLLFAISLEKTTRRRPGGKMPPLRWETDWCAIRIDWKSMRHPTGLGFALLAPPSVAIGIGAALLAGFALWWGPAQLKPIRAQRLYREGIQAEAIANDGRSKGKPDGIIEDFEQQADGAFQKALEIDPDLTGCRSHYAWWLVDPERPRQLWAPQKALEQLALTRRRLYAKELWLVEARAWDALGDRQKSNEAFKVYKEWGRR